MIPDQGRYENLHLRLILSAAAFPADATVLVLTMRVGEPSPSASSCRLVSGTGLSKSMCSCRRMLLPYPFGSSIPSWTPPCPCNTNPNGGRQPDMRRTRWCPWSPAQLPCKGTGSWDEASSPPHHSWTTLLRGSPTRWHALATRVDLPMEIKRDPQAK